MQRRADEINDQRAATCAPVEDLKLYLRRLDEATLPPRVRAGSDLTRAVRSRLAGRVKKK